MVAPALTGDDQWVSQEDEMSIQLVRDVITAVRSIRADMGINPGQEAGLIVRGPAELTVIVERESAYLQRLAKVSGLTVGQDIAKPDHAATAVVAALELFVPLEGLIDMAVERTRLEKRITEMEGRLANAQRKLDNKDFLERAPADVVAREREKQAAYDENLAKLRKNYRALA